MFWKKAAEALLPGVAGGLVLGIGGRVGMRLVALAAGADPGFSIGGTAEVILTGLMIGVPAALGFLAVRRRIPAAGLWKGAFFGALVFTLLALFPPPAARSAMAAVDRVAVTVGVFGPLFVLYGIVVERVIQRLESRRG